MAPGAEYEFTSKQETVFKNLIGMIYGAAVMFFLMFVVTIAEIVIHAHGAQKGAPPDVAAASDAIDYMFYAYFLRRASLAFEKVVGTEGSDISNLMDGLNGLYLLFKRMKFVSTIYVLKTLALLAIEHPRIQRMFKTPKSNLKSPLAMTAAQATGIIVLVSIVLTGVGAFGMKRDQRTLSSGQ